MTDAHLPQWLALVIQTVHDAELALLHGLDVLGLAGIESGQPAWPLPWRFDDTPLRADRGLARRAVFAALLHVIAAGLLVLAAMRPLTRWIVAIEAAALMIAAPTVPWQLLIVDSVPTAFHRSSTDFRSDAIVAGRPLFVEHCARCHGADARGNGPLASSLAKWPPTLAGNLLWQRSEGELFWRVRHGMRDHTGAPTMPGFVDALSVEQTWSLIDYLRASAAGASMADVAHWIRPIRAPDLSIRCGRSRATTLGALEGRRVRIVFANASSTRPLPDPRVTTIVVTSADTTSSEHCVATDPHAWTAYALVAGVAPSALPGVQFLVDRDGWLRARSKPGARDWSEDDYVCRAPRDGERRNGNGGRDGLGMLIARMDREPLGASAQRRTD